MVTLEHFSLWIYVKRTTKTLSESIATWVGVNCFVISVTNQSLWSNCMQFQFIFRWNFITSAYLICVALAFPVWRMNSFQKHEINCHLSISLCRIISDNPIRNGYRLICVWCKLIYRTALLCAIRYGHKSVKSPTESTRIDFFLNWNERFHCQAWFVHPLHGFPVRDVPTKCMKICKEKNTQICEHFPCHNL